MPTDAQLQAAAERAWQSLESLLNLPEEKIERSIQRRSPSDKGRGEMPREVHTGAPLDTTELMPWKYAGLCRTTNGNWMDVPNLGSTKKQREIMHKEIAICGVCPVKRECLEHAVTFPEPHFLWGGRLPRERQRIRQRRRKP